MRKTKIICTLGPTTDQEGILEALVKGGMDVARLNFSHGDHQEHQGRMAKLRQLREKYQKPIAMLLDTKGPEIRIGDFKEGEVYLQEGQSFTLKSQPEMGDKSKVSITYPKLYEDVKPGTRILLDDGLIELVVDQVVANDIQCTVKNGGRVSNRKGVNVPGVHVNMPYMSQRDRDDILFGIASDVDFIAASFVRNAEDVKAIRQLLDQNGGKAIDIIAKIENEEGVNHIDEIIAVADGIMIARGDMGVELPGEEVPIVQKMIIKKVYNAGKQVITATQMLDSMMKNPRPTRAESTDVANAIYDGTSAIMLSGETAAGKFPIEALATMVKIAERTEADIDYRKRFFARERIENADITDAICHATCTSAYDLSASAIVTVTKTGRSARMISRYRPSCHIISGTTDEKVSRKINMSWGIRPILLKEMNDVFDLFDHATEVACQKELLKQGDLVIITSGVPIGKSGTTNMMKIQVVE